jgi:hypothetical protein
VHINILLIFLEDYKSEMCVFYFCDVNNISGQPARKADNLTPIWELTV